MGVLNGVVVKRVPCGQLAVQPIASGFTVVGQCIDASCPMYRRLAAHALGCDTFHIPDAFGRATCRTCSGALAPAAVVLRDCRARAQQHRPVESEEYFSLAEIPDSGEEALVLATSPYAAQAVCGEPMDEPDADIDFRLSHGAVVTFAVTRSTSSSCVVA
uniref:Uncharacterized protein n=1 Tax=Neobodo designis TaxID=312471 RepID=A0A7S1LMY0_NEODS|mmetsp:Transcript_25042/g.77388  ORF Transcript_25042/g.77388 Transcript_25042/m.77388 type:complete len:160 (+) Transcript_25042:46-525(+)